MYNLILNNKYIPNYKIDCQLLDLLGKIYYSPF